MTGATMDDCGSALVLDRNIIKRYGTRVIIEGPFGDMVEVDIVRFEDGIASIVSICGKPVHKDSPA